MEKNNRPKVEFALNISTKLKMLRDRSFDGQNGNGKYHLYTVEHEGIEKAYFAEPEVHQQILDAGLKTGDEFMVTKMVGQNGKRLGAQYIFEPVSKTAASRIDPREDDFKSIMERSLRDAVEITQAVAGVPFQNEDIQKIASCLFIARTRIN